KRDGEIARAKNGDRPDRAKHGAKVWPRQRLPVGQSRVNAGSNPGALLDQVGEKPELIGRTLDLALKAGLRWKRRFQLPTRGKLGGGGIDAVRNGAQESRSLAARSAPVCRECLVRSLRRRIDVGNAGRGELGFKPLSTFWIDGVKFRASGCLCLFPRYDRKPFEFHHVAPMSMMRLLARSMGKNITEGHQALRNYVRDRRFLNLWGKVCCAPKDGPQVHVSQPSALLRAPRPLVPYAEHAPA